MSEFLQDWLNSFEWESEAQKKGALGFVQWAKSKGLSVELKPSDLFFIEKDHQSSEWFCQLIGDRVKMLEDQIRCLQEEIADMKRTLLFSWKRDN